MQKAITFNKSGYDPFIDYIKAFAIISVLIGHTFPYPDYWGDGLWIGMQVPYFVLVQSFHSFKRESPVFHFTKFLKRIFVPFLLIQFFLFVFLFIKNGDYDIERLLKMCVVSGGFGPGSYYPWIYLQIAILLPCLKKWMDKCSKKTLIFIFLFICESFEILSAVINLPDYIHRLLGVRYFFLLYFAWMWVREGIIINKKAVFFSLLSLLIAIYFYYFSINDEPFFYQTAWKCHRWPCYYHVAVGGVFLLDIIYKRISKRKILDNYIKLLAKNSYEIFLIQMAVLVVFPSISSIEEGLKGFGISAPVYVLSLLKFMRIALVFIVSIWGGKILNNVFGKFIIERKNGYIQKNNKLHS